MYCLSYVRYFNSILCVTGCGHCKKAKPEFDTASEHFKEDPRVELAAVDCTRHASLCAAYSVKGYPTIKYFSYLKTMRDYSGGRTVHKYSKKKKNSIDFDFFFQAVDLIKFLSNPDAPAEKPVAKPFGTYPGSDYVVILSDNDFEDKLKTFPRALVMFYAPCKLNRN